MSRMRGSLNATVATSPVVLRWLCDSPRTGCAWRITPLCMWREQAIIEWSRWSDLGEWPLTMLVNLVNSWLCLRTVTTRVISSGDLYCCLLPRCEVLRICRSGLPIATLPFRAKRIRVCLWQNGFFWHPCVVWKLLEVRLGYELSGLALVANVRVL